MRPREREPAGETSHLGDDAGDGLGTGDEGEGSDRQGHRRALTGITLLFCVKFVTETNNLSYNTRTRIKSLNHSTC